MARIQSLSTVLKQANDLPTESERVAALSKVHNNKAVKTVLKCAIDPSIQWNLPEGDPPYKPCDFLDQEAGLYQEARRLYLFVNSPRAPKMKPVKREALFISILESLDKEDAKLLLACKNKKLPFKNLTPKLLNKVFDLEHFHVE